MIAKIFGFAALVAVANARVFELHHGEHGSSYSSVSFAAAPTIVKTAPVTHVAPIAHVAPVVHIAPAAHIAPVVTKVVTPVIKKEVYADTPAHYSYEYGVKDSNSGDIKNQHEERNGDVVKGFYTLVQPDGVTRTVHYTSDAHSGFNANVEYKGEPIVQKAVVAKAIVPAVVAPVLGFAALVAFVQAGVFELHHGEHGTSYSTVNLVAVPAVVKTAHVAPVAHVTPVLSVAHVAPVVTKVVSPVVQKEFYPDTPAHYSFEYGVNDAHTGDVKNQHEERDGDVVKGYYTLVQPDGVTRTVHYTSDAHSGFNANVEYKGEPIVQKTVVAKAIVPAKISVAAPVYHTFSLILAISAVVAFANAGVINLHHDVHATSYSSVNFAAVAPAHAAPVAHVTHVAPVAHITPVSHVSYVAPVAHIAPIVAKVVNPVIKKEIYADVPAHYSYEYGVNDSHTGDIKNQHEERDGDIVKGFYTLVQPDGVTRTVHYTSDAHSGFNANVEYKGEPIVQKAVVPVKVAVASPVYHAYHH
ncbi:PREDICTED: uncharacterized protein LOC108568247 [Nicrophorus vespilloides]|uniref:Uncharacterized protein LOC108568247 n=1 Tax=Nicrophorus vespilloides TaxID=110193 RepID=A0ABM1ND10_NICVS|nr:PREDICTED: uncharacterized protein LOC108568247 [Nicrophorus vespilloides]